MEIIKLNVSHDSPLSSFDSSLYEYILSGLKNFLMIFAENITCWLRMDEISIYYPI